MLSNTFLMIVLTRVDIFLVRSSCVRVLGRARISHSLSGSRSPLAWPPTHTEGSLGTWATGPLGTLRRNSSQGSLGSTRVSGVGIVVVGVCRGGKKVFRVGTSERASASRGTHPPGFCLTNTRARVITGAETATAADVGIASSCPCLRLSGGTWWSGGQAAPRWWWWVLQDGREARWQGMGDGSRLVG